MKILSQEYLDNKLVTLSWGGEGRGGRECAEGKQILRSQDSRSANSKESNDTEKWAQFKIKIKTTKQKQFPSAP